MLRSNKELSERCVAKLRFGIQTQTPQKNGPVHDTFLAVICIGVAGSSGDRMNLYGYKTTMGGNSAIGIVTVTRFLPSTTSQARWGVISGDLKVVASDRMTMPAT